VRADALREPYRERLNLHDQLLAAARPLGCLDSGL
jgi:hypothetical protein